MSDSHNPYIAPQTLLFTQSNATIPVAGHVLPSEMSVVSQGLKFCLWSAFGKIAEIVLYMIISLVIMLMTNPGFSDPFPDSTNEKLTKLTLIRSILERCILVVTAIGYLKCSQIPAYSGAKRTAQIMLMLSILEVTLKVISMLTMKFNLLFQWPAMWGLFYISFIMLITALVAIYFALFLKQTASYLQDSMLVKKTSLLFKLTLIHNIAYVLVCYAIFLNIQLSAQNRGFIPTGIWDELILTLFAIINCWAFLLSLQILYKMRSVIDHGTQ